jgi:hypothetical protein
MGTIRKRGAKWQAQVRRRGFPPLTRTFQAKSDAELWARQREAEIDRSELPPDLRALRSYTAATMLRRYEETVTPRKRGADRERYKIRVLLAHPISQLSLDRLTTAAIAAYRDDRMSIVSAGTVRRELAVLQHCLAVARDEWGIPAPLNAARLVKLPAPGPARERRTKRG